MSFWIAVALWVAASALVYVALSINGKTDAPTADADHGHGHH